MKYRAVNNRCAVNLSSLDLPVTNEIALNILDQKGFRRLEVDVVELAHIQLGKSQYRRGARFALAPEVVDCSSFMKWLYAQRGIWLPRRTIQQRDFGEKIDFDNIVGGDLVFVSGFINYYYDNPVSGVGHAGIVTHDRTIIHAANGRVGVVEEELEVFLEKKELFRGARRYIPKGAEVITLETPAGREVELADDLRWIILQSLPK